MKFYKKILFFIFFKKNITSSNSNESTFYDDKNENQSVFDINIKEGTESNSWNESSPLSSNDTWNESSPDESYDSRREKIIDTLLFKEDKIDEELSKENESKFTDEKYNSIYFVISLVLLLILLIPPFLMKLIILFVIIIKFNADTNINKSKEYKQLHIFYDYEIYIDFFKSLDYNFYKSLNPFFGLMDAHIKSYIRLHGIDLHFYEVYPEVAEWRKRQYEEDFDWVFKRLNVILEDKNIVFVYSLDNIKEYGFKYYNY